MNKSTLPPLPAPDLGHAHKSFSRELVLKIQADAAAHAIASMSAVSASAPVAWGTLLPGGKLHAHRNSEEQADRRTQVWNTRIPVRARAVTVPLYLHPPAWLTSAAIRGIAAERERQKTAENWTPEHDDRHADGSLSRAAACYAAHASAFQRVGYANGSRDVSVETYRSYPHARGQFGWPWDGEWWKPTVPRRDLEKAGALIVAEIERIDRAAAALGGTD